jgi:hypothetical protein
MLQPRSMRLLSSLSHRALRPAAAPLSASLRCRRAYSIHADASVGTSIQEIDPSKLSITRTNAPKELLPPEELLFGRNFSGGSFVAVNCSSQLTLRPRSHAHARMDRFTRMAPRKNHTVPEPQSRPCDVRIPLRIRMLRGHEGVQRQRRQHQVVPPRQEHGSVQRLIGADCIAHV